jgi:putative ABC transport system substrate-binding protein
MNSKATLKFRLAAVIGFPLISVSLSGAQEDAKIAKIGELISRPAAQPTGESGSETLRRMLGELGYVEGKNIIYEDRYADGNLDRLPILVDELVKIKVDVLLTSSPNETLAAKKATATIPIVFYSAGDPVASGAVNSLARPGGI